MSDLITNKSLDVGVILNTTQMNWNYNQIIAKGAIYNLSISLFSEENVMYSEIINAPPLPAPNNFTVVTHQYQEIEFDWNPVEFNESE